MQVISIDTAGSARQISILVDPIFQNATPVLSGIGVIKER